MTSCYGNYTVGVNIKREMVLSPNDEEVASSKKHTQFKTREQKPYPISTKMVEIDTLFQTKTAKKTIPFGAAHTYIAYIREYPHGAKNALQRLAYASETNKVRGDKRLKTKTKRKNISTTKKKNQLSRESNLDHLHGE